MADNKEFFGDGFFDWQLGGVQQNNPDYAFDKERFWGGFAPEGAEGADAVPTWAIHGIEKYENNPIFAPDPRGWDNGHYGGGVHNGAVIKKDGYYYYLYRGEFLTPDDARLEAQRATGIDYHCDIGLARSEDGIHFERVAGPFFRDDEHFIYSYEDVCLVTYKGKYYAYFNQWDWVTFRDPSRCGTCMAVSDDLIHWDFKGLLFPEATRIHRNACVLQNPNNEAVRDKQGRFVMYLNNGLVAFSDDLIHWTSEEMTRFPGGEGCFALAEYDADRPDAIILFTGGHHCGHFYAVGEVLFDLADPTKPLEWLQRPVLTADPSIPYEDGKLAAPPHQKCSHFCDTIFFTGMTQVGDELYMYYGGSEYYTCLCKTLLPRPMDDKKS